MITTEYDYKSVLEFADNIYRIAKEFRSPEPFGSMFKTDFSTKKGELAFLDNRGNQIYTEYFDDNDFNYSSEYLSYADGSELKIKIKSFTDRHFIPYSELNYMSEEMYFQESLIHTPHILNAILFYGALIHKYQYKQKFFLDMAVYEQCMEYLNEN